MASKSAWWQAMGGVALALACPILGCGPVENEGDGASGGQPGTRSGNATRGDTGINTTFDELKLVELSGFVVMKAPEGSTCTLQTPGTFVLTSSTRRLSWSGCAPRNPTPG